MTRTPNDEPRSLRLYPKFAVDRARRELGESQVRSRWTRETVDPFDTPPTAKRGAF